MKLQYEILFNVPDQMALEDFYVNAAELRTFKPPGKRQKVEDDTAVLCSENQLITFMKRLPQRCLCQFRAIEYCNGEYVQSKSLQAWACEHMLTYL